MSDEEKAADVVSEAKGVTEEFVGILGLVDIIFGGLALYWIHIAFPGSAAGLPGTGHDSVDIALLAAAAAVVGKGVSLFADLAMAVVWKVSARKDGPSFTPVRLALAKYVQEVESAHKPHDLSTTAWEVVLEDSVAQIIGSSPAERVRLERLRSRAEFTYGVVILLVLFAWHFTTDDRWWLGALGAAFVVVLFYSGTVQQRAYLDTLRAALVRARAALLIARSTVPAAIAEAAKAKPAV